MLSSHNLNYIVNFPTRISRISETAMTIYLYDSRPNLCISETAIGIVTCLSEQVEQAANVRTWL